MGMLALAATLPDLESFDFTLGLQHKLMPHNNEININTHTDKKHAETKAGYSQHWSGAADMAKRT